MDPHPDTPELPGDSIREASPIPAPSKTKRKSTPRKNTKTTAGNDIDSGPKTDAVESDERSLSTETGSVIEAVDEAVDEAVSKAVDGAAPKKRVRARKAVKPPAPNAFDLMVQFVMGLAPNAEHPAQLHQPHPHSETLGETQSDAATRVAIDDVLQTHEENALDGSAAAVKRSQ